MFIKKKNAFWIKVSKKLYYVNFENKITAHIPRISNEPCRRPVSRAHLGSALEGRHEASYWA